MYLDIAIRIKLLCNLRLLGVAFGGLGIDDLSLARILDLLHSPQSEEAGLFEVEGSEGGLSDLLEIPGFLDGGRDDRPVSDQLLGSGSPVESQRELPDFLVLDLRQHVRLSCVGSQQFVEFYFEGSAAQLERLNQRCEQLRVVLVFTEAFKGHALEVGSFPFCVLSYDL